MQWKLHGHKLSIHLGAHQIEESLREKKLKRLQPTPTLEPRRSPDWNSCRSLPETST